MSSLTEFLNESILDPVQEQLSSDLWDTKNKLNRTAKVHIIKTFETWLKSKTSKKPTKMFILGSMTGYQYTSMSDIDINVVMPGIPEERLKVIISEMMTELNERVLPGTKHPVNYYITPVFRDTWKKDGAIYNIIKDYWLVKPSKKEDQNSVISNYRAVSEVARFFTAGLDLVISEYNADVAAYESYADYKTKELNKKDKEDLDDLLNIKGQEVLADIDSIYIAKHILWALRNEAFGEEGKPLEISTTIEIKDSSNNSINNLIYKYIEKLGYFDKVKLIIKDTDKWKKIVGIEGK